MDTIAINPGAQEGRGYETILTAFSEPTLHELCTPVVYGIYDVAEAKRQAMQVETRIGKASNAEDARENRVNIVETPAGEMPQAEMLVHASARTRLEPKENELLVTVGENMRIALPATGKDVEATAASLTTEAVAARIVQTEEAISRDFLLTHPRIALLSLHEDDQAVETDVLMPAIGQAIGKGINAFGPFPATEFFQMGDYHSYDGILTFVPSQVKDAFKQENVSFEVRYLTDQDDIQVAVGHDNVLDFTNAIYLATDIRRHREAFDQAHIDPLQKLFHDKREERR